MLAYHGISMYIPHAYFNGEHDYQPLDVGAITLFLDIPIVDHLVIVRATAQGYEIAFNRLNMQLKMACTRLKILPSQHPGKRSVPATSSGFARTSFASQLLWLILSH